jgi:hypothetical protein
MRARVTALYFFIANIIGLGVTPIIVGFINDAGLFGVSGINEAVSVTAAALLPTSFIILFVGRRALTRHQSQAMVRST